MRKYYILLIFLAIMLIPISACDNNTPGSTNDMPDIGIPPDEFNKKVKLFAPDGWNTFRIGDSVALEVEVVGDEQIAFAPDYGARLFIYEKNQWLEVANFTNYPEGIFILSPANDDYLKLGAIGVKPILPDPNKAVMLRIILVGNIYRDGKITDEVTAAYIDVDLKP
jgi:hypothetical protein